MFALKAIPLALLATAAGCATSFEKARTPSGDYCTDMPVYPAGAAIDKPYHRLRPVASSVKAGTEAERLDSLRREACKLNADAIIEGSNESSRSPDGQGYVTRASGTAVTWRSGPLSPTPMGSVSPPPPESKEKKAEAKPAATTETHSDEEAKADDATKSDPPPAETPPPSKKRKSQPSSK